MRPSTRAAGAALMALGAVLLGVAAAGILLSGRDETDGAASADGSPAASATSAPTESAVPTAGPETVDAFVPVFVGAVRDGDAEVLFARLHPEVVALYGEPQCRDWLDGFEDATFDLRVEGVSGPEPWTWEIDERSTPISDAFTVTATITRAGAAMTDEIHFALDGGRQRWFTDCGDPVT